MLFEQIGNTIAGFESRRNALKNNGELSPEGKRKALQALQAEIESSEPEVRRAVELEVDFIKSVYRDISDKQAQAEQEESERWNYLKLISERDGIERVLRLVHTPEELEHEYGKIERSGVPERKRALYEVTPELALRLGNGGLAGRAKSSLAELRSTPELAALEQRGAKLVARTIQAQQVSEQASAYFHASSRAMGGGDKIIALWKGVKLSHGANERGESHTLDISE